MYTETSKFLKGYKDANGVTHLEFEFREMDGNDEEALAKPKIAKNGALIIRTILERCLLRIGSIEKSSTKPSDWTMIIQQLTIADQDFAMMQIRELSLGEVFKARHKCPNCGAKIVTELEINSLPIKPYNGLEVIPFELPRGYKDKEGNVHTEGTLKYPTGLDRELLETLARKNPSSANTLMLARCIVSLGDVAVHDDLLRNLSMRDRNYLMELIKDSLFGYDLNEFDIECSSCGETLTVSLNQSDFL